MKHLKSFESIIRYPFKKIYNKNDYVRVSNNIEEFELPYAKIISGYNHKSNEAPIDRYYVEILFPNTKHWSYSSNEDQHTAVIEDYLIVKKLSKKEIEEYELKSSANKYNL